MRLTRPRVLPPLRRGLPLLLAAALLPACTSGGGQAPEREAFRPPPEQAFAGRPCELVAADVVTLGRAAHDLRGVAAPDQAARDALQGAQDRLSAVAETADASVRPALDRLVLASGLVRLQSDTRMLEPETLERLRAAYDTAVTSCTTGGPGAPSTAPPAG